MPKAKPAEIITYTACPERLQAAISGLTTIQLAATPLKNEWSIHEIIVHLADGEANGFFRLRKTLAEPEPYLPDYAENAWASNLSYPQQDYTLALRLFSTLREANAALLQLQSDDAWERIGIHEVRGRMTVYDLFHALLEHGEAHLRQIEEVKQAL
jgi:hypothetical protein